MSPLVNLPVLGDILTPGKETCGSWLVARGEGRARFSCGFLCVGSELAVSGRWGWSSTVVSGAAGAEEARQPEGGPHERNREVQRRNRRRVRERPREPGVTPAAAAGQRVAAGLAVGGASWARHC